MTRDGARPTEWGVDVQGRACGEGVRAGGSDALSECELYA